LYETFEHTADMGLRVRAPDLDGLFAEAALGLFSLIVEDLDTVRPADRSRLRLDAESPEDLLRDWLGELLFLFDTQHRLFRRFEPQVDAGHLVAEVFGEGYDPRRHRLGVEVKAVTYHGLALRRTGDGFEAELILDI
jgi:SHS2 domain-containing protein